MQLAGVRHVGLTVTDLQRSIGWYGRVLGFAEWMREEQPGRTVAVLRAGEAVVGLVRFTDGEDGGFSPRSVGLDHLCFRVASHAELDDAVRHLDACGVRHSGVQQMSSGPIVNFRDPDGIALALALAPQTTSAHQPAGRRVVNPWTWQDRAGFVQAHEVPAGGRTLYCAGAVSVDGDGRPLHAGDLGAQALQALDNVETVLHAAGYTLADIVRLNTYTTDLDGWVAVRAEVQGRLDAAGCRYAATLLGVAQLARPELLVELEATAVRISDG